MTATQIITATDTVKNIFSSQNIWNFFCSHTVRTLYIIEEIAIVGRTSRGECGVCAAGKDISSLRSVLIRIFILLSLIRNNFSLIVLGESEDGAHRQPGAQQQHWHRRHGKCDCRKNVTRRVRCSWEGHLYIEVSTHTYLYVIKFNKILLHKLTGRESNRMDFKQEYFIMNLWLCDGSYVLTYRLVKFFHIAPPAGPILSLNVSTAG